MATPPTPTDLGTLGGTFSVADFQAASGLIAGRSTDSGGAQRSFAWTAGGGMVDLGDLDGDGNVASFTEPRAVSSAGHVVGIGTKPSAGVTHAFRWHEGTMTDLGDLSALAGGDPRTSVGTAVNASGHVTGQSGINDCTCLFHAFLWNGVMNDLGTLGGRSWGVDINDSGLVAAYSEPPGANEFGVHATYSAGGQMVDIGTLGGSMSRPVDLNNAGQMTGNSTIANDAGQHAFYWTLSGGMVDIGTLGGNQSTAIAINESGQVIGWSTTASGAFHAFLWTLAGGIVDIGTFPGGTNSQPVAINESGKVVGWSNTDSSGTSQPFIWTVGDGMTMIGNLGGSGGAALDINEAGQVVGNSPTAGGVMHAFAWSEAGGTVDLGTLSGGYTTVVDRMAVTEDGQVAGNSVASGGSNHGVVWQLGADPTATTTALSSSANPALVGEAVTYTATVDPVPDGGTVAFEDGGTTITGCEAETVDGSGEATCTVSGYGSSGTHSITADYSGTSSYAASTSDALSQAIDDPPATSTTTALVASVNPALVNQSVTYTATVSPVPTGGTVAFDDGGTTISGCGTAAIDGSGQATCAVSGYGAAGTRSITAVFSGSTSHATSTSSALSQQIAYGIRLLYDPAQPSKGGGPITVTVQLVDVNQANLSSASIMLTNTGVTPTPAPGRLPTGTFTFRKGSYSESVHTGKWPAGSYTLQFTAGADPTTHSIPITVQ